MMKKFKASTNYGDFYINAYTFMGAYDIMLDYIFKRYNDYFPSENGIWEITGEIGSDVNWIN